MGAHAELAVLSRRVAHLKRENLALKALGAAAVLLSLAVSAVLMLQAKELLK